MSGPRVGEDVVATQPEGERGVHRFRAALAARMTARLPLQERLSSNRVSPMGCRLGPAARRRYVHDMCGRARLSSDVSEIKLVFSIPPDRPTPNFPPSWNVAPTDSLPVVRYDTKVGQRSLDMLRWGLIPYWAKDIKVGFANINAKAEGIDSKPAFRDAFQRRRCLVPADNFYEWKKNRDRETALCAGARRSRHHGARGCVGELALAGRRVGPQLRDRHHHTQRIVRRNP
jgi:hypothetical protein